MREVLIFLSVINLTVTIYRIDPRQNMWVTWANQTGQDSLCLSMSRPEDPFRTCLIGFPKWDLTDFNGYYNTSKFKGTSTTSCTIIYDCWESRAKADQMRKLINALNVSSPLPLQEIDLLGSVAPLQCQNKTLWVGINCNLTSSSFCKLWENTTYIWEGDQCKESCWPLSNCQKGTGCVRFGGPFTLQDIKWLIKAQNVSGGESQGTMDHCSALTWNNDTAKALPPGYFLICGNRAWAGIPARPVGGPCYIGRLTMFIPKINDVMQYSYNQLRTRRSKRAVSWFDENCKDTVEIWGPTVQVLASFFTPNIASAQNARNIKNLACWAEKQFNLTSEILTSLLYDVDSIRHAVLQNRAAIDFLLLAQGHGCEDFEGMCCMNLSDHSVSIHAKLQTLQDNMQKITIHNDGLDAWLQGWDLTGWLRDIVKQAGMFLLLGLLLLLMVGIAFSCLKRILSKIANQAWIAQKQEGGIVEEWLEQKGHLYMSNPSYVLK